MQFSGAKAQTPVLAHQYSSFELPLALVLQPGRQGIPRNSWYQGMFSSCPENPSSGFWRWLLSATCFAESEMAQVPLSIDLVFNLRCIMAIFMSVWASALIWYSSAGNEVQRGRSHLLSLLMISIIQLFLWFQLFFNYLTFLGGFVSLCLVLNCFFSTQVMNSQTKLCLASRAGPSGNSALLVPQFRIYSEYMHLF